MDPVWFWTAGILSAVSIGFAKGGFSALGPMAVPLFALAISPITAAGILLPVLVAADAVGVIVYRKHFDTRVLKILAVGGVLGIAFGWLIAARITPDIARLIVGGAGLIFTLNYIVTRGAKAAPKPFHAGKGLFWTSVTGFTSFVSHAGMPPFQIFVLPLKLDKLTFAGTVTIAFAYMNAVKLLPYAALGQINLQNLKISAVLMIPALISVFIAKFLVSRISEKAFFAFAVTALGLVSVKLVFDGLTGL